MIFLNKCNVNYVYCCQLSAQKYDSGRSHSQLQNSNELSLQSLLALQLHLNTLFAKTENYTYFFIIT